MIFVSMSSDELLERTAQYQIHYPSRSRRCHESRRHYSNPSREYFNTYRSRTQGTEAGGAGASSGDLDAQANESTWSRRSLFDPTYAEPQFRVTTEHDGNPDSRQHDDDDFPSANDVDLLDSGEDSELFCPVDEDDSDGGDTVEFNNRGRLDSRRRDRGPRNSLYGLGSNHRLNSPSLIEPARSSAGAAHGVSGDMNGISNIMKPHARFFIEREKSMVSINFDPPVYAPRCFSLALPMCETLVNIGQQVRPIHPNQTVESLQRRKHRYREYHGPWLCRYSLFPSA
jgi:hypothetical protein